MAPPGTRRADEADEDEPTVTTVTADSVVGEQDKGQGPVITATCLSLLMAAIRLRPLLSWTCLHLPCLNHSFARRASSSSLNMAPSPVWDEDLTSKLSREIKREEERYQKVSEFLVVENDPECKSITS